MIKTVEELKEQAKLKNIKRYPVHDCSICGYPCSYYIDGDRVEYDSGCDCVSYTNIQPRDWEDVAYTYNMNQPENNHNITQGFLDSLNKIWQFDATDSPQPGETPNEH